MSDYVKMIDLGWPWRLVAKWREIELSLLLITNRKSHIGFQVTFDCWHFFGWSWMSLTTSIVGYPSNSWASCFACMDASLPAVLPGEVENLPAFLTQLLTWIEYFLFSCLLAFLLCIVIAVTDLLPLLKLYLHSCTILWYRNANKQNVTDWWEVIDCQGECVC